MIPDLFAPSIYRIDYRALWQRGIRGLIFDLDNTLVETTRPDATPELLEWLHQLQEMGFHVVIVSNNNRTRVSQFAIPLQIPYIHRARKPLAPAFRQAMREMQTEREETAVVGDQLLTDVLGGNRLHLYTILVAPISEQDAFFTRFNRQMERHIFRWMHRRGLTRWEEKK
ncbi:YqeG family HAD IIIA-type phosphatase [Mechercharimyces sp. CAU 1602]|uniref:YqeG family HAD IIIA-type phosphatase n=1 Tax=Mechercharimyces sp. CAU 1602 TaxID=2973933 RepID=UPI002161D461|nr:YqeG family HAD IIIA-type phosphatase [Mechercharimyces sp. CAU 1602]MCS1350401.1 YqeG family HAD IIIA-type phosphatase [Mechercharimyces sp. CAU 1602]